MTESKAVYSPIDPDHLTPGQLQQLRVVLSTMTLHQWLKLAVIIRTICREPGFGTITIVIKQGHPDTVEAGHSEKLLQFVDADQLANLLGE